MKLGTLKQKIYALLDLSAEDSALSGGLYVAAESKICGAIDSVLRKTVVFTGARVASAALAFVPDELGAVALLPADFIAVKRLLCGNRVRGREQFEIVGGRLYLFDPNVREGTLFYFAYPPAITETTADDTDLGIDDYDADAVSYGAAAMLCPDLYPADATRYMRLSTEYDERIVNRTGGGAEQTVASTLFSRRRGLTL